MGTRGTRWTRYWRGMSQCRPPRRRLGLKPASQLRAMRPDLMEPLLDQRFSTMPAPLLGTRRRPAIPKMAALIRSTPSAMSVHWRMVRCIRVVVIGLLLFAQDGCGIARGGGGLAMRVRLMRVAA